MSSDTKALYLYALSGSSVKSHLDIDALPALMGPIHAEQCHEFIAVFSSIPDIPAWQDEIDKASVDWVTSRAVHHARVIEHLWRRGPVYPARFGTLFSSHSALAERLAPHRSALTAFLANTAGLGEWDIKLFFDPEDFQARWIDRQLGRESLNLAALPAGIRYLAEQRLRREASQTITQELVKHCQALANELVAIEDGIRERPLPAEQDPKHRPLAHWAVLQPLSEETQMQERLATAAETQAACGISLQWSGPWPPYTFRPVLPNNEI